MQDGASVTKLYAAVRKVGWLSIGSGLAMMVAPRAMARAYGFADNRTLVRLMGLRDVVIGSGILAGDAKTWMKVRTASDGADVGLILYRVVRGPKRPVVRLFVGVVAVGWLARLTRQLPP